MAVLGMLVGALSRLCCSRFKACLLGLERHRQVANWHPHWLTTQA